MKQVIYTELTDKKSTEDTQYIDINTFGKNFGRIGSFELNEFKKAETVGEFYHTLWTKPLREDKENSRWFFPFQYYLTLPLAALSLALLKKHGQRVVLYTDIDGKELLSTLPYDKIYNTFDNFNYSLDFWAAGKMLALQNSTLDMTQIDTDLFIYDGRVIDKCNTTNIICSHYEKTDAYNDLLIFAVDKFQPLQGGSQNESANAGLIKINDIELRTRFLGWYWQVSQWLINNPSALARLKEFTYNMLPLDLVTEQYSFYRLCNPTAMIEVNQENGANTVGIVHPVGFEKYIQIPKVLNILETEFLDYYQTVMDIWSKLDFQVSTE